MIEKREETFSGRDWTRFRIRATVAAVASGPFIVLHTAYSEFSWRDPAILFVILSVVLPIMMLLYLAIQSRTFGFCQIRRPCWRNSPFDRQYPLDTPHFVSLLFLGSGIGGKSLVFIYGVRVLPHTFFFVALGTAIWLSVWLVYRVKYNQSSSRGKML